MLNIKFLAQALQALISQLNQYFKIYFILLQKARRFNIEWIISDLGQRERLCGTSLKYVKWCANARTLLKQTDIQLVMYANEV